MQSPEDGVVVEEGRRAREVKVGGLRLGQGFSSRTLPPQLIGPRRALQKLDGMHAG